MTIAEGQRVAIIGKTGSGKHINASNAGAFKTNKRRSTL